MKIAIIGRTEILYKAAVLLKHAGNDITCILTAKEAPEYKKKALDFCSLADQWDIPFAIGSRIIDQSEFFKACNPDIAVSVNYVGLIPKEITDIFPLGILNLHSGDLPKYRGNACQSWAILNGEEHIGLCVHRMIGDELDTGDIIIRDYFPINLDSKVTQAWDWMLERGPELILQAVEKLTNDPEYILQSQANKTSDGFRCYPRLPEDGKIEWINSAEQILRLINATNKPFSGAFCSYEEQKMIIWDAEVYETKENFFAVPGQVLNIHKDFVTVACGEGVLKINKIQLENAEECVPSRHINTIRKRLR